MLELLDGLERRLARRRHFNAVIVYGVVNALPQLVSAVLAILYTSAMTLKEYGGFGILSVIVGLVGIILDFGIPQAILRHYYEIHADWLAARRYLSDMAYGARIVALAFLPPLALIFFVASQWFSAGQAYFATYLLLVLSIAYFDRSSQVFNAIFRALDRPAYYAIGPLLSATVQLGSGLIFVWVFHLGLKGALASILLSRVVAVVGSFVLLRRGLGIGEGRFHRSEMWDCLKFGLPLVPNRLAMWARASAVRPALVRVVPVAEIGLYSLGSSVASLPILLSSAVELALSPHYFRRRAAQPGDFGERALNFGSVLAAVLAPIWAVGILFSPELVHIFAGQKFQGAAPMCALLLCGTFVRSQHPFLIRQVQFLRQTWILPLATIPCAVLSIGATLLLARQYGIVASAFGVVAADFILYGLLAGAVRAFERVHHPIASVIGLALLLLGLAIWTVWSGDVALAWRSEWLRAAIAVCVTVSCTAIWIWPQRLMLRQLLSG